MPEKWFDKYCQKHYPRDEKVTEDTKDVDFDLFYELSEFDEAIDTEKAWANTCSKLQLKKNFAFSYWKVAAAILILLTISAVGYQQYATTFDQKTELAATVDSQKKYQLADGSLVTLDRKSLIKINENSFIDNRRVELKGKAFFNVRKGTSTFSIATDNGLVEVLGTQFDVVSKGTTLKVIVYSGVVQIANEHKKTPLQKGEIGILSGDQLLVEKNTDPNAASWRTGNFNFENQPLKEIIPQLEAYYDVKIESSKTLLECKVTAQFTQDPLADVISTLTTVLNAKSKKSGNKISITGKGC